MEFDGVQKDGSVLVIKARELAEKVRDGEMSLTQAKAGTNHKIFTKALELIRDHGWDRKTSAALRRARTDQLVMNDDPEVAIKAIGLSQKEDGVGSGPAQATQINVFRDPPPPELKQFFDVEGEDPNAESD